MHRYENRVSIEKNGVLQSVKLRIGRDSDIVKKAMPLKIKLKIKECNYVY